MDNKHLRSEFLSYPLDEVHIKKLNEISNDFNNLLIALEKNISLNRCFSICKTKLEEACFFAKKSYCEQNKKSLIS